MAKNDLLQELTDFLEEKLKEIYEIPISEHVCVQIWETTASIHIPYVTPDTIKIRIDGLLGQLRGITNITSYLRSKTHFVKNILKNGINCKSLTTPFFEKEMHLYMNNRKVISKMIDSKQKRVSASYSKLNEIAMKYMLDFSEVPAYNTVKWINDVFRKFNSISNVNKNLEDLYAAGYSCSLDRGVVTVSIDDCPLFEHYLCDSDFDSAFKYPETMFDDYKKMCQFFETKISDDLINQITRIARLGSTWIKSKKYFELEGEAAVTFKVTTNSNYSDFFIDSVSLSSEDVIKIYETIVGSVQTQSMNFNKMVYDYLSTFLDPINYIIVKEVANKDTYNLIESLYVPVSEIIMSQAYIKDMPIYNTKLICTSQDVAQHYDYLLDKGYIKVSEDGKITADKAVIRTAKKMLNMYLGAHNYIESYLNPEPTTCSADESHDCSNADSEFCPICGAPLNGNILVKKGPMKKTSIMSVFEVIAMLNITVFDNISESLKDEIIDLIDMPVYSIPLKNAFITFFEKYNNGELLPLIEMKYILS